MGVIWLSKKTPKDVKEEHACLSRDLGVLKDFYPPGIVLLSLMLPGKERVYLGRDQSTKLPLRSKK